LPVLFEDQPEIVFLPMLHDAVIDLAALRVPQWNGASVAAFWPVDRIPRSPLFAGHRPTVAATHHVFHLTLVTNREQGVAQQSAGAGTLKAKSVYVGVVVLVDVDQLKRAEVYTVGKPGPRAVEEVRVEDLKRE